MIAGWLQDRLMHGVYNGSKRIESENELAELFQVTRLTARQAITRLEQAGLVTRIQGKGTFAYQPPSVYKNDNHKRIAFVTRDMKDQVFTYTLEGAKAECEKAGYQMDVYATADNTAQQRRVLQSLLEAPVDGLIVEAFKTGLPAPNEDVFRAFCTKGIPLVFLNGYYHDISGISYVVASDRAATSSLVDHLVSLGHKKIGGIFNAIEYAGYERYKGYLEGLVKNGLAYDDHSVMFISHDQVEYVFDNLFNAYRTGILECTAMVCFSDHFARHLEATLARCGLTMPGDMSITGIDDLNFSFGSNTRLTTAVHPKERMGSEAVQSILDMLASGNLVAGKEIPMPIVIGNSTSTPRSGPIATFSPYMRL